MLLDPSRMMTDGGGDTETARPKPYKGSSVTNQAPNTVSRQFGMQTSAATSKPKVESPSLVDKALALPAQFAHNIVSGIAGGLGISSGQRATGVTPPPTTKLDTKTAANITKTVAGELSGVAPAKRVLKGTSTPVLGSKGLGTALDIASAIPVVGSIGKGAAVSGALGKTAKEVGAIQAAGEAAKVGSAAAKGKVGAVGAAAMIATSPAGHAADIVKPVTKITQSVDAAKGVKTAVKDVKTSAAPKTSVKSASQDVTFTPKAASKVAPGTKTDIGSKVTKAAIDVSAASKASQFKLGTADHTKSDTKDVKDVKDTVNSVTNINKKAEDIKQVSAKSESSKKTESNKKTETKVKDSESKSKTDITFNQGDIWNADDIYQKPYKNPYENKVNQEGEVKDGGKKEPGPEPTKLPSRQFIPIPSIKTDVEELNRKRKWNPSAIV